MQNIIMTRKYIYIYIIFKDFGGGNTFRNFFKSLRPSFLGFLGEVIRCFCFCFVFENALLVMTPLVVKNIKDYILV